MFMPLVSKRRDGMKQRLGLMVGTVFVVVGILAPQATAKLTLREVTAVKRFDSMVVRYHRHLTKQSPGGAACERRSSDRFACQGRWKAVADKDGVRTRFVYEAEGVARKGIEEMVVWARMRRWEIAEGTKRGPIRGTVLKAHYATDWPLVVIE